MGEMMPTEGEAGVMDYSFPGRREHIPEREGRKEAAQSGARQGTGE